VVQPEVRQQRQRTDERQPGHDQPAHAPAPEPVRTRPRRAACWAIRSSPTPATTGHCTDLDGTWTTGSGQTIGSVAASSFPGNDSGAIRISNPATLDPRGGVLNFGSFLDITSAGRVPDGSQACKTGSTTGTTCGTVLASNVTVNYAEGTVFGLTRTSICTQPGDSGGAMFAGSQAQGIVSGGTVVSCSSSSSAASSSPPTNR
jgi:hypothetical protein